MSVPQYLDLTDEQFLRYAAELPDEYPPGHADYVLSMRDRMNPGQVGVRIWLSFDWPTE